MVIDIYVYLLGQAYWLRQTFVDTLEVHVGIDPEHMQELHIQVTVVVEYDRGTETINNIAPIIEIAFILIIYYF